MLQIILKLVSINKQKIAFKRDLRNRLRNVIADQVSIVAELQKTSLRYNSKHEELLDATESLDCLINCYKTVDKL